MAHARWSDIIRWTLAGFAAVGIYYLFVLFHLDALGTAFAILVFISLCSLEYYIPYLIKKKGNEKRIEKYNLKKQQEQEENINNLSWDSKICPICSSKVKKGNKYCYKCGNQI